MSPVCLCGVVQVSQRLDSSMLTPCFLVKISTVARVSWLSRVWHVSLHATGTTRKSHMNTAPVLEASLDILVERMTLTSPFEDKQVGKKTVYPSRMPLE